jgi:hypothetical protein
MMLPPNHDAAALNNIPNAPSAQATMAAQQQGARDSLNLQTQEPQANAALKGRVISDQAAGATSENAANAALDYAKARIMANAGLTQGSEAMVGLAQRYAPQSGDPATIARAIHQGLRL